MQSRSFPLILVLVLSLLSACAARPGAELNRSGDEIVIAGRFFHTSSPVVLWTDPGGYDAYRVEKRFAPWDKSEWTSGPDNPNSSSPNRLGVRFAKVVNTPQSPLSPDDFERIRGGGWDLPTLQRSIDQFVIHYDVCGVSRQCFRVLHDLRGLSVHFLLDIDGTIYQTMDVKDKAWHATSSNDRSVGIEIANIGAYARSDNDPLDAWYEPDLPSWDALDHQRSLPSHQPPLHPYLITIPPSLGDGGLRSQGPYYSASHRPILGHIQNRELRQMDFTPQQYQSLINLTAVLCSVLPNIKCDFPKDPAGNLITTKLPDDQLAAYQGLLGHFHIQDDKVDPGPAFRWDLVTSAARKKLRPPPQPLNSSLP